MFTLKCYPTWPHFILSLLKIHLWQIRAEQGHSIATWKQWSKEDWKELQALIIEISIKSFSQQEQFRHNSHFYCKTSAFNTTWFLVQHIHSVDYTMDSLKFRWKLKQNTREICQSISKKVSQKLKQGFFIP